MMRLEQVAKTVADQLKISSVEQLRAASLVACKLALRISHVDNQKVLEALNVFQQEGKLSTEAQSFLKILAEQLDESYFELQEKAENDPKKVTAYLRVFAQARAVSALSYAGIDDPLTGAMEAIYEALATVEDPRIIYDAVLPVLLVQ